MTSDFRSLEKELRWVCRSWWRSLNGINNDGNEDRAKADRQARAELRRLASLASGEGDAIDLLRTYAVARFHDLDRDMKKRVLWIKAENVALTAVTLAYAEKDVGDFDQEGKLRETARLLGTPRSKESKEPLFAEVRFKRLIRTDEPAELLPQMVRAVKILGNTVPVGELGASLLLWGPSVKKRWAFAYWQRTYIPVEPSAATETSVETV